MQFDRAEASGQLCLGHDREQKIAEVLDVEGSCDSDFHRGAVLRVAAVWAQRRSIHFEKSSRCRILRREQEDGKAWPARHLQSGLASGRGHAELPLKHALLGRVNSLL